MKATKLLLSSLVLAGMLSACANEEQFEVVNPETTLSKRAQVNLTLDTPAETRLGVYDGTVGFSTTDQLGAVIVDGTSLFDVNGSAIGNNKWTWNGTKFVTEGTTAVGSWLFYAQYNNAITTSRDGVTFKFPQIQEGAADKSMLANNNINFHISPVLKIDGYEGESVNVPNKYSSVYNYLNIKLALPAGVTAVEKIVVSAMDNQPTPAAVKFPAVSKVVLNNDYPVAKMAIKNANAAAKIADHDGDGELTYEDQVIESKIAQAKLSDITLTYDNVKGEYNDPVYNWDAATSKAGAYTTAAPGSTTTYDYLVVDCDAAHTTLSVVDGKFSTYMLMPAGVYSSITLKIYTNKGVYTKEVNGNDFYKENLNPVGTPTPGAIILRPQASQSLANVKKLTTVKENEDYIKIPAGTPTAGDLITQTSDLISFINALPETAGKYNVNILSQDAISGNGDAEIAAHKAVVNAAVMQALAEKQAKVTTGDVVLWFRQTVDIVGNTDDQLELKNLQFSDANIVSGNVKIVSNVTAPSQVMTAKAGSVVEIAQTSTVVATKLVVEKGATVDVTGAKDEYVALNGVEVFGKLNVKNTAAVSNLAVKAGSVSVTAAGNLSVNDLTLGVWGTKATYGATLANTGIVTINVSGYSNNATISNNGKIYVKGAFGQYYDENDKTTSTVTTNGRQGIFEACGTSTNASIVIGKGTTFVNKNELQTAKTGYTNTITNEGTIDVFAGATTLITKNAGTEKGIINLAERAPKFFNVSDNANKGYIVYKVSEEGTFTPNKAKDVFNTIVFEKAVTLAEGAPADYGYISNLVAYNDLDMSAITSLVAFNELTFVGNGAIYTPDGGAKFNTMTIAEDVKVALPAMQKITILTKFVNNGTFVVSGTATIKSGLTNGDVKETGGNITWN